MFREDVLPLNARNAVYHLDLLPEEIADTILCVGDPGRVSMVSQHFDRIDIKRAHREFVTHTGYLGGKRISVLSTGIGMPNIDIVMQELDALFSIDLSRRERKEKPGKFRLIRLGTTGAMHPCHMPGAILLSQYAIGMGTLLDFYCHEEEALLQELRQNLQAHFAPQKFAFFLGKAEENLSSLFQDIAHSGITLTCNGFYGPQGRSLRIPLQQPNFLQKVQQFRWQGLAIQNMEMETAAIYALGQLLGHDCLSLSLVISNRDSGAFVKDVPQSVAQFIAQILEHMRKL